MEKNNPTIQDSRQAAEQFLNIGAEQENKRNKKKKEKMKFAIVNGDFTDTGVENSVPPVSRKGKIKNAVNEFLRFGKQKEALGGGGRGEMDAFEIADMIGNMSDEEFDKAVANGELTPEMIRKAGEYERQVWDDDVWSETDEGENNPLPPYDEFFSNLDKYGYDTKVDYHKYTRYNPNRYKK